MTQKGIEIVFKDGILDYHEDGELRETIDRTLRIMKTWVSPVNGMTEDEDTLGIDNGSYTYTYRKSEIKSYEFYEYEENEY